LIVLKNERFYFYQLAGGTIRFRNILRKKGKKLEPMIQMETIKGSKWLPVLRCDRSHGFLHIDLYDYKKVKKTRRDLASKDAVSAIVEVIDLLKREWKKLFEELHHDEIVDYFMNNQESIKSELDNARAYLLNEAKQPDSIVGSRGKGVIGITGNAELKRESED
jgi:hypothetical protein